MPPPLPPCQNETGCREYRFAVLTFAGTMMSDPYSEGLEGPVVIESLATASGRRDVTHGHNKQKPAQARQSRFHLALAAFV